MTSIQMPQLGETIVEGTILKWLKKEGESVARDEPLFEISTDKVDTEVPSPVEGTVTKILVAEGETVPVGTELAEIDGAGDGAQPADGSERREDDTATGAGAESLASSQAATDDGSAAETPGVEPATATAQATGIGGASPEPTTAAASAPTPPPALTASSGDGTVTAAAPDRGPRSQILSPVVRKLAREHGLDLGTIRGTGTGGRITRKDVEAAAAAGATAQAPAPAAAGSRPALQALPPIAPGGQGMESQPMSHIRKAIGKHMLASVNETARAWTLVEANVEHLVRLRERSKDAFLERYGVKLTYLPFVVRATIDALQAFPPVNARIDGDNVISHRYVNMGIAVSYDAGLIVPVIAGADGMNTVGIARAIADLAARARSRDLKPAEVQGATFTITNPGPYGSLASVPIINQPNTGILSLDGIQKRPVVVEGDAIAVRHMVYVSMSWDHRSIDGEIATRFLARVKQNLETWDFAEDLGV